MNATVKHLVLPPDATGTKTHEWFRNYYSRKYWIYEDGDLWFSKDGKLIDLFAAHAIAHMWECAGENDSALWLSIGFDQYNAWTLAAENHPDYVGLPVVGFEERNK